MHVEVHLLRLLNEPVRDPVLPSGWQVRAVSTSETVARADIQHEVWQRWYVGQIVGDDYARLMHVPGYERDLDVVTIAPDGVIAAYAHGWIDPLNQIGGIGPVGARTAYRRQGLTRAALLEVLCRMRACGMTRVCISTGQTNTPALRLYQSLGFRIVSESHDYTKPAVAGA
jgi:ribosomal protein S18 acetylase RimI-like enzyme